MKVAIGEIVTLTVKRVSDYACWGTCNGQTGFVHCVDWTRQRPIPESRHPKVGGEIRAEVFRLVTEPQDQLPLDVTFGGEIKVDFAASAAQVELWETYARQPGMTAPTRLSAVAAEGATRLGA